MPTSKAKRHSGQRVLSKIVYIYKGGGDGRAGRAALSFCLKIESGEEESQGWVPPSINPSRAIPSELSCLL